MLITILSPLLFFAPDIHLRHFRLIWVDNVIHEQAWRQFVTKVQEEWDKFLLPVRISSCTVEVCLLTQVIQATVLLSVNVGSTYSPSANLLLTMGAS
jgi:hypothetical protein